METIEKTMARVFSDLEAQEAEPLPTSSGQSSNPSSDQQHEQYMLRLWVVMSERFGYRWFKPMGEEPNPTWTQGLRDLTRDEWLAGITRLNESVDPWPPSLPEFRGWCIRAESPGEAKQRAGVEFDANPLIDGTSKFDADRETYEQRDRRRKYWISRAALEADTPQRRALPPSHGFNDLLTSDPEGDLPCKH